MTGGDTLWWARLLDPALITAISSIVLALASLWVSSRQKQDEREDSAERRHSDMTLAFLDRVVAENERLRAQIDNHRAIYEERASLLEQVRHFESMTCPRQDCPTLKRRK